jgi:hypothetical protein
MPVEPEVQAEFDRLMNHARTVGGMMADTVLAGNPPPWDEQWFLRFHANAIEQSGEAFKIKWPDLSETIILNMQVRFRDGMEARLRAVLGGGHFQPGADQGRAN